ncbi:DNA-binding protein [Streptomyces sp. NPDC045456]|uniref:DNA-binding protein n=1 Tax=Streptomyces sp. NPDC045456 TaxID=3155254 RepID=UPI00340CDB05
MASEKFEKYARPAPPADLDAEYMTIQETAFVLRIGVTKTRELVKQTGLYSRMGRRIITSKADRAGLYEACHAGGRARRRTARRRTPAAA